MLVIAFAIFPTVKVLQWNLSKMVTVLNSHLPKTASLPGTKYSSTKTLQSTPEERFWTNTVQIDTVLTYCSHKNDENARGK